jgi:phosphodiester glycosidase
MSHSASMPGRAVGVACTLSLLVTITSCSLVRRPQRGLTPAHQALSQSDSFRVQRVQAGVRYLYAWQHEGPWAIHVLEVQPRCKADWQARKGGPPLTDRARTSILAFDALAGVNADFFDIPRGTPVGAHVTDSEVLVGPGDRTTAVSFIRNRGSIEEVRLDARVTGRRFETGIAQVNRPRATEAIPLARMFTHWYGAGAPRDSLMISTRVRRLREGRGVVELIDSVGNGIWLDTTHIVLHLPRGTPIALHDTIRWTLRILRAAGAQPASEVLGGFPRLLRGGENVLAQQANVRAEFSERRHPRTAVGFARDGTTLLVVVDGRQPPYSDGMTLPELADLMRRMGALDALNLDGGGSSSLVVRGRVLNRPSDREGERAVGNALALVRCR